MRYYILFISMAVVCVFLGSTFYFYLPVYAKITRASALIYPTKGNNVTGIVIFNEEKRGLRITAELTRLTPGKHGFHVHEFGMCNCSDAVCAGDHYNPTGARHGGPDDVDRHMGDFGNIIADEQGVGRYDRIDTKATLSGPHSLIGRTVIIHADADDYTTQPTGNSGARIGCGVVGIAQ